MQTTKAGIREFRENLANYIESNTPVAITRHGSTIGIHVPTKPKPTQADLEAFRIAGEKMQALVTAAGTTEDELIADFEKLRRKQQVRIISVILGRVTSAERGDSGYRGSKGFCYSLRADKPYHAIRRAELPRLACWVPSLARSRLSQHPRF
jgi:hypothetical protein